MADQKETGKGIEIRKGRKRGLEGRKIEDTAGKGQRGGVEISIEKRILLIGFLKSEKDLKEISAWNCKRGIFGRIFRDGKGKLTGKDRNKLQNERCEKCFPILYQRERKMSRKRLQKYVLNRRRNEHAEKENHWKL